jgi:hypothetical protein
VYVGYESDSLGIAAYETYTVSFDCRGANQIVTVDLSGTNVDSEGKSFTIAGGVRHFSFTEVMPANANGDARLRVFTTSNGGNALVSNIKVEYGAVETAWTDDYISPTNAARRVLPNSINNTMIGGDLYSSNWNGQTGKSGQGWLLRRDGVFYCNNVIARGALYAGSFTEEYRWPYNPDGSADASGSGFHLSGSGMLLGNPAYNRYFQVTADGNVYAPGFRLENSQVYVDNPIITGGVLDAFYANQSGSLGGSYPNGSSQYGTASMNVVGGRGPLRYYWFLSIRNKTSNSAKIFINGDASLPYVTVGGTGTNCDTDATLTCICIDANSRAITALFPFHAQHGVAP